ncbi:hypothetical protein DFH09DRAFT_1275645 [Mycena vulgaris]|nr:hypothetical protein DFH09DRAFT_1275645 [Mycena vulgaris]
MPQVYRELRGPRVAADNDFVFRCGRRFLSRPKFIEEHLPSLSPITRKLQALQTMSPAQSRWQKTERVESLMAGSIRVEKYGNSELGVAERQEEPELNAAGKKRRSGTEWRTSTHTRRGSRAWSAHRQRAARSTARGVDSWRFHDAADYPHAAPPTPSRTRAPSHAVHLHARRDNVRPDLHRRAHQAAMPASTASATPQTGARPGARHADIPAQTRTRTQHRVVHPPPPRTPPAHTAHILRRLRGTSPPALPQGGHPHPRARPRPRPHPHPHPSAPRRRPAPLASADGASASATLAFPARTHGRSHPRRQRLPRHQRLQAAAHRHPRPQAPSRTYPQRASWPRSPGTLDTLLRIHDRPTRHTRAGRLGASRARRCIDRASAAYAPGRCPRPRPQQSLAGGGEGVRYLWAWIREGEGRDGGRAADGDGGGCGHAAKRVTEGGVQDENGEDTDAGEGYEGGEKRGCDDGGRGGEGRGETRKGREI